MATSNPPTYIYRTTVKNVLGELSACRRVALKSLPANFFIYFLADLSDSIQTDIDYRGLITQAYQYWRRGTCPNAGNVREEYADATIDIFKKTMIDRGIEDTGISAVYKEYLLCNGWITTLLNEMVETIIPIKS
jgi:hypothetical protein